jgi:SAM-dependent methyltransferase
VLSDVDRDQRARLDAIAAPADAGTFAILQQLGVGSGWSCAEIGAGSGTVAAWLCERVGPTGTVVGTDINTRWLETLDYANLRVQAHDIAESPLDGEYDIVHTRNVLCHVSERERAFAHLIAAVRAGGWLLVEDVDFFGAGACYPPSDAFERMTDAIVALMQRAGADPFFGRKLPYWVADAGFVSTGWNVRDVSAADDEKWRLNLDAFAPAALAAGLVTAADVDVLTRGQLPLVRYGPRFVAAWGSKPRD